MRGNLKTQYVVERVLPDRARMIQTGPSGLRAETVIIRDRLFLNQAGKWHSFPLPIQAPPGSIPSMADLFSQGASNIAEHTPQRRDSRLIRVFTADIKWTVGQGNNEGKMEVSVDDHAALPAIAAVGKNTSWGTDIESRNVLFLPR